MVLASNMRCLANLSYYGKKSSTRKLFGDEHMFPIRSVQAPLRIEIDAERVNVHLLVEADTYI
ncbi:MAG: hypothetical protein NVS4B12_21530 [Ktedonobacteraceae bacterium]